LFQFISVDTTVPRHLRHVDRIELIRRNPHLFRHPTQKKKKTNKNQNKSINFQTRFLFVCFFQFLLIIIIYLGATFGADGPAAEFAIVPPRAKNGEASLSTHEANLFVLIRFSIEKIRKIEITKWRLT
jgi:hypothetical protein